MIRISTILILLLLLANSLQAQFPATNSEEEEDRIANEQQKEDSTKKKTKKVNIRTERVDPDLLLDNQDFYKRIRYDLGEVMIRDEQEALPGYSQTLGQVGKPYTRYQYGVPSRLYDSPYFENPLTRGEDAYFMHPEHQMPYFNSQTPYVNLDYLQGRQNLTWLKATVSANPSPFVNVSGQFGRRQMEGAFRNATTDQYSAFLNTHFFNKDNRYHLFTGLIWQELNDEIHGGLNQDSDSTTWFSGLSSTMNLESAQLSRTERALVFRHYYQVINDTLDTPHRITIFNSVVAEEFYNQFTDTDINADIFDFTFPLYPTLDPDASGFLERALLRNFRYKEGFGYRMKLDRFQMGHKIEIENQRLRFIKEEENFVQNLFIPQWRGNLNINQEAYAFDAGWTLFRRTSNFFPAETYVEANAGWSFPKEQVLKEEKIPGRYPNPRDSILIRDTYRTFSIKANYLANNRNPSLLNSFYTGYTGNAFSSQRDLRNEFFQQYRLHLDLKSKITETRSRPHRLSLTLFNSLRYNQIYYDSSMQVSQAPGGRSLSSEGASLSLFLPIRFWLNFGFTKFEVKNLFLEGNGTIQRFRTNAEGDLKTFFLDNQPPWFGKGSLYYENRDLSIAAILRIGLDVWFRGPHTPLLFDAPSQQFYPQSRLDLPGIARVDAHIATQINRVYIALRFFHGSQGLGLGLFPDGYFTTPWYPMMKQNLMLVVNWTFFD